MVRKVAGLATALVLASSLAGASASVAEAEWRTTHGGWASGSLEYVKTVPFEAASGIDSVLHGNYLYATSWRSFSIYDVSDPLNPELLSQIPSPGHLINENPQTDGKILLLSNDNINRRLEIWDVEDKRNPEKIGEYPEPSGMNNHFWTCVMDCRYAYGGMGSILDLSDPTDPRLIGMWTDVKRPRAFHSIQEVAPGRVLTGSDPILYLDARQEPASPTLLAELKPKTTTPDRPYVIIGPAATSLPARMAWPMEAKDRHVLVTMETPFSGECDSDSGTFLSYDSEGWDEPGFGGFELVDEYEVTGNDLPSQGSSPVNAFGCGAYGLQAAPSFGTNRLVATTWFEHGTRLLRVGHDGKLTEVGGFVAQAGNAVRPLWRTDDILYVTDFNRGIDILRVTDNDRRYRTFPYAQPGGDLDGDGADDVLTSEDVARTEVPGAFTNFDHRVAARRGLDGASIWQRPDRAETLLAAKVGPQAQPGALVVDGLRTFTGGGGGISSGAAFGERAETRDLVLTAVGGDGATIWSRVFASGAFAGAAVADEEEGRRQAVVAERFPTFAGLVQATPSDAMDVLVSVLTRRETPDRIETRHEVSVVDGATGQVARSFDLETEGARSAVHAAPDLDGDGLDDVLILRDPTPGGITARRTDGTIIWTNPSDIVPFDVAVEDLGDVTDDGLRDLAVRGSGDVFDESPPRVTVLDGSDGSVLFSTQAHTIVMVGELGQDGPLGLLAQRVVESPQRGVSYRLFSPDGEQLAESLVPVADGTSISLLARAGDLDGDGVTDAGHRVVLPDVGTTDDGTFLSGRTLEPIFASGAGLPLRASLDGEGDDLVRVERSSASSFAVVAQDGSTGAALWSVTVEADERYTGQGRVSVERADVTGDGAPDVVLSIETSRVVPGTTGGSSNESIIQSWVLRGSDGRVLWSA